MFITNRNELTAFAAEKRIWQGIPSMECTRCGRLFATFYSGTICEDYGNFCILLQSDDDGATWSDPIGAAYAGESSRCFDPELWMDPLGRLWFTWAQYPENTLTAVICEDPDADTLVWSAPRVVGEGVMMQSRWYCPAGSGCFPSPYGRWKRTGTCRYPSVVPAAPLYTGRRTTA